MGGACTKGTVQVGERTMESDLLDRQLEESKAREELHFKVHPHIQSHTSRSA